MNYLCSFLIFINQTKLLKVYLSTFIFTNKINQCIANFKMYCTMSKNIEWNLKIFRSLYSQILNFFTNKQRKRHEKVEKGGKNVTNWHYLLDITLQTTQDRQQRERERIVVECHDWRFMSWLELKTCFWYCVFVCVCVCVRERGRKMCVSPCPPPFLIFLFDLKVDIGFGQLFDNLDFN